MYARAMPHRRQELGHEQGGDEGGLARTDVEPEQHEAHPHERPDERMYQPTGVDVVPAGARHCRDELRIAERERNEDHRADNERQRQVAFDTKAR